MTPEEQAEQDIHCRRLVKLMFAIERQSTRMRQAPMAWAERNVTDLVLQASAIRYALGKLDPDGIYIEGYEHGLRTLSGVEEE